MDEDPASYEEAPLIALTNRTKLNGRRSKARAIVDAAGAFLDRGLETRADILADLDSARAAYTGVDGLGR